MATVMTPQHASLWQRQPDEYIHIPNMNMSDILSSYEASRTVTHPSVSRTFQTTAPHMGISMPPFAGHSLTTSVPYQPGTFAFDSLAVNPYSLQQHFPMGYANTVSYQAISNVPPSPTMGDGRNRFPLERTPPPLPAVKLEPNSPIQPSNVFSDASVNGDCQHASEPPIDFATHVDTLMKAIQAKQKPDSQQRQLPAKEKEGETKSRRRSKKRHQCTIPGCDKRFYQKTHLQIHIRSHTGDKPFVCNLAGCGQRFSQLGNLKTHERRHTGEKPFKCDVCGRGFAQRGNVRAHKIVHEQVKPYTCQLDTCSRQFTQLGNLKSHQNKFHIETIRILTEKFTSIQGGDEVTNEEKRLWEYFAGLYKNSNKGIKGRGKDRRISGSSLAVSNSAYSAAIDDFPRPDYAGSSQHSGSDRISRSSSMSSDAPLKEDGYDFNTSLTSAYSTTSNPYGDLVFPERKLF